MNEEYSDLVERYLCNELSVAERAAFEERLASDEDFRQTVTAYQKAVHLVRLEGRKALREELAEHGKRLDAAKNHQAGRAAWWWVSVVVLVILVAWWWVFVKPKPVAPNLPVDPIPTDTLQSISPVQPDTPALSKPEKQKQREGPTSKPPHPPSSVRSTGQLFAAYFQPYKDESLEPSVRGQGDATPEEVFQGLYWEGKYREATAAFDNLQATSKNKGDLQFLRANCLLATGDAQAAIGVLEGIGRTRFQAESRWLLGLAYLKNGEREKAVNQLQQIKADTKSVRQADAGRLLDDLD